MRVLWGATGNRAYTGVHRVKKKRTRHRGANICFECENACGGCSWSRLDPATGKVSFTPVEGWTAQKTWLTVNYGHREFEQETYKITACPEFVPSRGANICADREK